jgi:NhaP-type Na+/H+ and K+/H+ antiporters
MALALSLPLDFPGREELIVITFGVVLFTLLVPGLTIEPLVKLLQLMKDDRGLDAYERLRAQLYAETQALVSLSDLSKSGQISNAIYATMAGEIEKTHRSWKTR